MSRKNRRFEPVTAPVPEDKNKPAYQDHFQSSFGRSIEEAGKKLEGKGRTLLYGLGALAVLAVIVWIFYAWSGRSNSAAQAALGKAIDISESRVTDTAPPAGSTEKVFKTEKERADAAIAEFQSVADKFGGDTAEKAKYFIAVNRLYVDRQTAVQELETLAKNNDAAGRLSKFALAQTKAEDGKADEAIALYQELTSLDDAVLSKATINFEIAKLYEKQGKIKEASDLLFDLVKTAAEAKDLDGKPVALTATARAAKERLQQIAPERAAELPQNPSDDPNLRQMSF
ncbi:MAG: hypothetical protein ABI539_03955 [Acidobacteriota bacterium]